MLLFTTRLHLLKATNSSGPGARQSTTDSAQHVDHLYESIPLAFKALYASCLSREYIYLPFIGLA